MREVADKTELMISFAVNLLRQNLELPLSFELKIEFIVLWLQNLQERSLTR